MDINLKKSTKHTNNENIIIVTSKKIQPKEYNLNNEELDYINQLIENKDKSVVCVNKLKYWIFVYFIKEDKQSENNGYKKHENCRKTGSSFVSLLKENNIYSFTIIDDDLKSETLCFIEGLLLGSYQFLKYKTDNEKDINFKNINVISKSIKDSDLTELTNIISGVYLTRDLINEPVSYLTAEKLSESIDKLGKEANFKVEILHKIKIEALKMGGILAVNQGSAKPPTLSILEWKPEKHKNKKPIILVGKGIVFDSGGINLKPSGSIETMKSDMSGAAAVAGAIYAIAKSKLPYYVIGIIPATDNMPSGSAKVPGDVIKMFNGKTVEILNTDAEGRLILADALSYAKKYDPELVIDIATLTGAASAAIGKYGIVAMGTKSEKEMTNLKESGFKVYERIVEFPFWDDYNELIKSEIADIKNIGGKNSGAITAGKFLEHFVDYPWIHLDIAGSAFSDTKDSYRGIGGTGVGVRLFYDFIKNYSVKSSK